MLIGLTGGIGSGKSLVARMLGILGCEVFNSDAAAKDIYFDPEIRPAVKALLGDKAYLSDSEIDRAYISQKIFSDTDLLRDLNNIIHPGVKRQFERFVKEHPGRVIVKETALLFEVNIDKDMDRIIVVSADDELRIRRVMERDGLSREQVQNKIKSQLSQEEKVKKAHFVIHNNEKDLLIPQVLSIFNSIKN